MSPAYSIAILLSVPAGLILALYFAEWETWQQVGVSLIPAVLVLTVAYFHTRARKKSGEG